MSANHNHDATSSKKTLLLALIITLTYAGVEAVGGWLANSLALIGDAGHMLTDAVSLGVAAFAAWLTTRPASSKHSYGLQRAEVVGALFNVLFMYIIVAAIVVSAVSRLQQPQNVHFESVLLIGGIGLGINIVVAWLLNRGEQNLNTRGALLHVIGDLLGSVAAIAAGFIIWLTGWMPIDPILSLLICVLIVISSTRLLLETLHLVMEGVPKHLDIDEVRLQMSKAHPDIKSIHHLHIWGISSSRIALSAHIELDQIQNWETVLNILERQLADKFEIHHPTLQPEFSKRCSNESTE